MRAEQKFGSLDELRKHCQDIEKCAGLAGLR